MTRLNLFVFLLLFDWVWSRDGQLMARYQMPTAYLDEGGAQDCLNKQLNRRVSGSSGWLMSHDGRTSADGRYRSGRDCFLVLQAPRGYRIRLTARQFLVPDSGPRCANDSLHVFDQEEGSSNQPRPLSGGQAQEAGPLIQSYCGRYSDGALMAESTHSSLLLWWHTDNNDRRIGAGRTGFRLRWTVFRNSSAKKPCRPNEFGCQAGDECIPRELACDRHAHCSDGSDALPDQMQLAGCADIPMGNSGGLLGSMSGGVLAGLCFAIVLGSVATLVCLLVCCKSLLLRLSAGPSGVHSSAAGHQRAPPLSEYKLALPQQQLLANNWEAYPPGAPPNSSSSGSRNNGKCKGQEDEASRRLTSDQCAAMRNGYSGGTTTPSSGTDANQSSAPLAMVAGVPPFMRQSQRQKSFVVVGEFDDEPHRTMINI